MTVFTQPSLFTHTTEMPQLKISKILSLGIGSVANQATNNIKKLWDRDATMQT
jgi:hypothetical protein